jgi:hypothetical protein
LKAKILVTYDENGQPRFPALDIGVQKGWSVLLFGEFV